ncbi:MAG: prephenate dehydrogenase/arogenate dehydrogenase family protein [Deltaproteobacteria bacterium]|nr:prephenate dehydrogenase/arogenate dehydrogenase family protein [Deltaproteobacteria bacterium]
MDFSKITIIGLGLIGGSLAWALKKAGNVGEVYGVDIEDGAIEYAIREHMIDHGSKDLKESVNNSDIVVIATYVGLIPKIVKSLASALSPKTTLTDVGSVKVRIVTEIERILPNDVSFVGGHPISGTERSGISHASAELFNGKNCILTPTVNTDADSLSRVKKLWESVGANVYTMDPEVHDRVFAYVSHLPHTVAYALLNSVASGNRNENIFHFAGGGLKDFTRIGESSPEMWSDIFIANRENVLEAIADFKNEIEKIRVTIEKGNLKRLKHILSKAAKFKKDAV